jgi:hypothetical protein
MSYIAVVLHLQMSCDINWGAWITSQQIYWTMAMMMMRVLHIDTVMSEIWVKLTLPAWCDIGGAATTCITQEPCAPPTHLSQLALFTLITIISFIMQLSTFWFSFLAHICTWGAQLQLQQQWEQNMMVVVNSNNLQVCVGMTNKSMVWGSCGYKLVR